MYMECRHIKTNGLRCKSPALKGGHFCYYHSKTHTLGADHRFGPLQLPAPEDAAAIQLSVARINDAILNGRMDLRKAATLFNGLRIAAQFIDRRTHFQARGTVQSAELAAGGDELAPANYVCNDDEDCNQCPYSDRCSRCLHPGDEGYDDNAEEDEENTEDLDENEEEEDEEDEDEDEDEEDEDEEEDEEEDDDYRDDEEGLNRHSVEPSTAPKPEMASLRPSRLHPA